MDGMGTGKFGDEIMGKNSREHDGTLKKFTGWGVDGAKISQCCHSLVSIKFGDPGP